MENSLLFAIVLVVGFFILLSYGAYLLITRRKTILAERLETYAGIEEEAAMATNTEMQRITGLPGVMRLFLTREYMARVEEDLARADIPMRPTEYILLRLLLGGTGA